MSALLAGGDYTPEQVEYLTARAIPATDAAAHGVLSVTSPEQLPEPCPPSWAEWLPALLFPWRAADGRVEWQIRPDVTPVDKSGNAIKYATRSREAGYAPLLWLARQGPEDGPRLLVEGTCQTLAAAIWAPEGVTVAGMIGCRGWSSDGAPLPDLAAFGGGNVVVVALDADMTTNPQVWDAGEALQRALAGEGAVTRFLRLPGTGKVGLDDVLGRRPVNQRTAHLERLIGLAEVEKFPKSRRPKPPADPDSYFGDGGLRVEKLSRSIYEEHPSALTQEERIALYEPRGVYEISGLAFVGAVARRLGDDYRPGHRAAAEEFTAGTLYRAGRVLPVHIDDALLNVKNGMLDLATGTLKPHDPDYMSSVQLPIEWDPTATCPKYEQWCEGIGIGPQLDDLEELVSLMLDPSRTPTKAVMMFGPSRSGKGTFLRLLVAVAGAENVSGVSLKQLAEDKFAAANVYGKSLNVSGDLSSADVTDLSLFKMLTGEDLINADRKYGRQFVFTNRALFAFSANELPAVSESSRAYSERIKPFRFGESFAGHEDPNVEVELRAELPGILVRWVRAWRRLTARGTYLPTAPEVRAEFEVRSDRVRQWVSDELSVTLESARTPGEWVSIAGTFVEATVASGHFSMPVDGQEVPAGLTATPTELAGMFRTWTEAAGTGRPLGRNKLLDRLTSINGVERVRRAGSRERALNLTRRPGGDPWDGGEPPPESEPPSTAGTSGTFLPLRQTPEKRSSEALTDSLPQGAGNGEKVPEVPAMITMDRPPMRWDRDGTQAIMVALAMVEPPPVPVLVCPECDRPETLVPVTPAHGGGHWYACRSCTPATFERD